MKKIITLFLTLALSFSVFALTGCDFNLNGGSDNDDTGIIVLDNGLTVEKGVIIAYTPTATSGVELVIPQKAGEYTIKEIKSSVFADCKALTKVTFPNSIETVGADAFYFCKNLKEVHINSFSAWVKINFANQLANPLSFSKSLYVNETLIEGVVNIPSDVIEIGTWSLVSLGTHIDQIIIHKDVIRLGRGAFEGGTHGTNGEKLRVVDPKNWQVINDEGKVAESVHENIMKNGLTYAHKGKLYHYVKKAA